MQLDQVLYGLGRAISDHIGIDRPERADASEANFPSYLDGVIEHLGGYAERLVLLFDEFDVVDQTFTGPEVAASRFIPYLARLVESHSRIGYLLVVGRKTEEMSEVSFGTILKDSVTKQIGRLNPRQTARLVSESSSGQLEFDASAHDRIYELAAGHPFCTQMLCYTIWNRALAGGAKSFPVKVSTELVNEVLPEALEMGSNGLNWIYDGMSKPSHRLVLSALAETADPATGGSATLGKIDMHLRERRIALDTTELSSARRDLIAWDVLVNANAELAFAVPMIGAWIRLNRPLEALQQQTALLNPRAQRYYELALESLSRDNYDAAIEDFRNALTANAGFVEALRGLSNALRMRNKAGDVHLAVEAYERVLDLEPNEPRTPLLELLAEEIDNGCNVITILARYRRLKEIGEDSNYLHRGTRILVESALEHEGYGKDVDLTIANMLYSALADGAGVKRTKGEQRRRMIARYALFAVSLVPLGAALNAFSALDMVGMRGAVIGGFASLAGALIGYVIATDEGIRSGLRVIPGSILICFIGGLLGQYLGAEGYRSVFAYGVGSLIAGLILWASQSRPDLSHRITLTQPTTEEPHRKLLEALVASWKQEKG